MTEYRYVPVDGMIWGQLPSGEIHEYKSVNEYTDAYRTEENEIYDEMARLNEHNESLFPDSYLDQWMRYA